MGGSGFGGKRPGDLDSRFNPLKLERVRSRIHTAPAPIKGIFLNLLRLAKAVMEARRMNTPNR